jgi:hypothetical protein
VKLNLEHRMNCLEVRRLLLAAPRERCASRRAHLLHCSECARLAHRLTSLERGLEDAALVPVPEALTARVLLGPRPRQSLRYAAAAVLAGLSLAMGLLASGLVEAPVLAQSVHAVGPTHPAVIAIAEVVADEIASAPVSPSDSHTEMDESLKRMGLSLKEGEASARYIGKCRIEGTRECEHIVLSTPEAHANVMLVPDYPLQERVLVADRHMVALVSPAGAGGYIVIADSAKTAKRMEKLFVKS